MTEPESAGAAQACADREPALEALLFDELEASEREALDRHLEACARCREALEDARRGLASLRAVVAPPLPYAEGQPPEEAAWVAFSRRLAPRQEPQRFATNPARFFSIRQALAAAAVLALGIGIGRWAVPSAPARPAGNEGDGRREFQVDPRAVDALARAELLSDLGIRYVNDLQKLLRSVAEVSVDAATPGDLASARERARELLGDGRLLRRSLHPEVDLAFLTAIDRAEVFLEELAAVEDDGTGADLYVVQASLRRSRLPDELRSLDVERKVALALEASGGIGEEQRKDAFR